MTGPPVARTPAVGPGKEQKKAEASQTSLRHMKLDEIDKAIHHEFGILLRSNE